MSDKPRAVSFVRKLRQQLCRFADGRIRRRIVLCAVALVTIATGSAITPLLMFTFATSFLFSISRLLWHIQQHGKRRSEWSVFPDSRNKRSNLWTLPCTERRVRAKRHRCAIPVLC